KSVFVLEENSFIGGLGSAVANYLVNNKLPVRVHTIALPDRFIPHGSREVLLKVVGLDSETIADKIMKSL
ncbi:MAG: transketolase C-terminal domain-containing protein, partial [candidate division WOR-3 bacterium]